MIRWIYKPSGNCPVQAEGHFAGSYFYFRARGGNATIDFAPTEAHWDGNSLVKEYTLWRTDWPKAGWLPKPLCRVLIWWGCVRFWWDKRRGKIYRYKETDSSVWERVRNRRVRP